MLYLLRILYNVRIKIGWKENACEVEKGKGIARLISPERLNNVVIYLRLRVAGSYTDGAPNYSYA